MRTVDPITLLKLLQSEMRNGDVLTDDQRRTVSNAIGSYLSGNTETLDQAFGVDAIPGQHRAISRAEREERRRLLGQFACIFFSDTSNPARAAREYLTRYDRSSRWNDHDFHALQSPYQIGSLAHLAWRILRLAGDIPTEDFIRRSIQELSPMNKLGALLKKSRTTGHS